MTRRWIVVMSLASASLGIVGAPQVAHAGACVGTTCSCDDECSAPFTCVGGQCCNFGADSTMGTPCADGAGGNGGNGGTTAGTTPSPTATGTANPSGDIAPGSGGMGGSTTAAQASGSAADTDDDGGDDGGCSLVAPHERGAARVGWGSVAGLLGAALFMRRRKRWFGLRLSARPTSNSSRRLSNQRSCGNTLGR